MTRHLKHKPIIFIGFGRCGSTIVSEIIFRHQQLAWISNYQQKFPSSSKVNLLRNLFDNPLWRMAGKKKQLTQTSILNKYVFQPSEAYRFWNWLTGRDFTKGFLFETVETPEKIEFIHFFFNNLIKFQKRERLAFKITGPARLGYLNSIFPNAYYIYIKRSPLPNLRSLLNSGFYQGRASELWWDGPYSDKEQAKAKEWVGRPELIAALQYFKVHEVYEKEKESLSPEQILEINYEDFIEHPEGVINQVLNFTELESDKNVISYMKANKVYDQNRKKEFYFSINDDTFISEVAKYGV